MKSFGAEAGIVFCFVFLSTLYIRCDITISCFSPIVLNAMSLHLYSGSTEQSSAEKRSTLMTGLTSQTTTTLGTPPPPPTQFRTF